MHYPADAIRGGCSWLDIVGSEVVSGQQAAAVIQSLLEHVAHNTSLQADVYMLCSWQPNPKA